MNKLERLLKEISEYYLAEADLYLIENYIPCELNELIYFIKKKFDNKYYRLLEKIKSPFGYWDHYEFKNENLAAMTFNTDFEFHLIDYNSHKETEYNLSTRRDSENLNSLLHKTIEILNYARDMENYNLEHTITANTDRY